ncbi:hypothetical protein CY35_03G082900 [Sphagnum magellanicum]|nr:hypothetical protein CY35_03G082900 [Sphagnum magellanicum]KAH9568548.1 hypothetical protein CY35_03G082900 [Sphagnum magellanicum]
MNHGVAGSARQPISGDCERRWSKKVKSELPIPMRQARQMMYVVVQIFCPNLIAWLFKWECIACTIVAVQKWEHPSCRIEQTSLQKFWLIIKQAIGDIIKIC